MREIKVRKIHKGVTYYSHNGVHYPGYIDLYSGGWCVRTVYENGDHGGDFSIEDVELFTGLKDRNGKEIYEGDVVKFETGEGRNPLGILTTNREKICVVEWNVSTGSFNFRSPKQGSMDIPFHKFNGFQWPVELIGNIHENGDLLNDQA